MLRTTDFQFCTNKADPDLPLAIVRYTAHDEDDKIVAVEQITYEENPEYFQTEVLILGIQTITQTYHNHNHHQIE